MKPRAVPLFCRAAALSPWAALGTVAASPYARSLGAPWEESFVWFVRVVGLALLVSLVAWPLVVPLNPAASGRSRPGFIVGVAVLVVAWFVLAEWGSGVSTD